MEPLVEWYICRHGETADNVSQAWTSQLPGELNEKGKAHAKDLGEFLRKINPDFVASSDLKRAIDTRDIAIITAGFDKPHTTDKRIREVYVGEFQGKGINEIREMLRKSGLEDYSDLSYFDMRYVLAEPREVLEKKFGFESLDDVQKRINDFVGTNLLRLGKPRKILTIGHGMINAYTVENELFGTCGKEQKFDGRDIYPQSNNEVTILRYNQDGNLMRDRVEMNVPIKDLKL